MDNETNWQVMFMGKSTPNNNSVFEIITKNIQEGVYLVKDNKVIFLNDRFGKIFGYDKIDTLLNHDMYEHVLPDSLDGAVFQDNHNQLDSGSDAKISWGQPTMQLDGTSVWVEVEAKLVKLEGQEIIFGTVRDITQEKLTYDGMSTSSQTLHRVLNAMEAIIYVVTEDYQIVYGNHFMTLCAEEVHEALGLPKPKTAGDCREYPCYKLARGRDTPCEDCKMDEVFAKNGEPVRWEVFGEPIQKWLSVTEVAVNMPNVDKRTKLVVARDITPWKKAEERIRTLSHGLLKAQEAERNRLSRELHDDLGQQLNAIKLGLNIFTEDIPSQKELQNKAMWLNDALQTSISSVRELAVGLRPSFVGEMGLVESIRTHCDYLSSTYGMPIEFKTSGMKNLQVNDVVAINLYRVVQEALHNVVKHAEAEMVKIKIAASPPLIQVHVEDNGKGFNPQVFLEGETDEKHLGLLGMVERADILNGTFDIVSKQGEGTKIKLETNYVLDDVDNEDYKQHIVDDGSEVSSN